MCCGTEIHHGWGRHHGGFYGCGASFHCGPRFLTKEQKIARLEEYLQGLQEEAKAIEERTAALKGEE